MNVIWATGGGAVNIIFERLGGVYFAARENWNPDIAVALMWTASGFGSDNRNADRTSNIGLARPNRSSNGFHRMDVGCSRDLVCDSWVYAFAVVVYCFCIRFTSDHRS